MRSKNIIKSVFGQQFLEQRLLGLDLILAVVYQLDFLRALDTHSDHKIMLGCTAVLVAGLRLRIGPRVGNTRFFAYQLLRLLSLPARSLYRLLAHFSTYN